MKPQSKTSAKRTSAPKVLTGCLTCKRRHKKCDEEKPHCRRCIVGGFVCDGYARATAQPDACNGTVTTSALIGPGLPGNALDNYYSHHFFTYAINDLTDMPNSNTFWADTAGLLYQQSYFAQPAIIALGAAHWLFLSGVEQAHVQGFINQHYNNAIAQLIPALTTGKHTDLPAIMTCCLLFICLESLRGNQAAALRHLDAGSRLFLGSLAQPRVTEPDLQRLAAIFHALGNQAALFSGKRLLPDPAPHLSTPGPEYETTRPLRSYDEANDALDRLDGCFQRLVWNESLNCENHVDDECKCPRDCQCLGCQEWHVFTRQVNAFSKRLSPLLKKLEISKDCYERQRLLRLKLQERWWQWIIEADETFEEEDLDDDAANAMLDLVERILQLSAARPTFSLTADIIPTLVFIYDFCPSTPCRQRAIDLLRLSPRQEVIFNSGQTAALLEDHMSRLSLSDEGSNKCVVDFKTWPHALIEYQSRAK